MFLPSFLVQADAAQWSLWPLYWLALFLLMAPGLFFFQYGARARQDDILGNFNEEVAHHYLVCFHPELQPTEGQTSLNVFTNYYQSQFGLRRFVAPTALCYVTAAVFGWVVTDMGISCVRAPNAAEGCLAHNAVLAFLGGYTWVTYDQIIRSMRADLTPRSQLVGTLRLLIAVPMAFSISTVFNGALGAPIAYLLGTFPTETVFTIGRRALAKALSSDGLAKEVQHEIQKLTAVDIDAAERFGDEGVTSVLQLAYSDPVRLAIRTNLGFSYVVGCQCEALLWIYLQDQTPRLRPLGIAGAYECRVLWEILADDTDSLAYNRTKQVVDAATKILGLPTSEAVYNVLYQVAEDPFTCFVFACWAANMMEE